MSSPATERKLQDEENKDQTDPFSFSEVEGVPAVEQFRQCFDDGDYDGMVAAMAYAMAYSGFNPHAMRQALKAKGFSYKQLLVCLTAAAYVGNNPERLSDAGRVTESTISREAYNILRNVGVVRSAQRDRQALTLARIAICYAPIYWKLREGLVAASKLVDQFPGTISADLQDPNLGPIAVALGLEHDYRSYESAFNLALRPTQDRRGVARDTDWLAVAVRGAQSDGVMLKVLGLAIATSIPATPSSLERLWNMFQTGGGTLTAYRLPALRTARIGDRVRSLDDAEEV